MSGGESPEDPLGETSEGVRRALRGDRESLAWVVGRLTPLLLAQARYRMARLSHLFDPEDLVNDTWLRALPRLDTLIPRGTRATPAVVKFLSTVMRHRIRDLVAKHVQGKPVTLNPTLSGPDAVALLRDEGTGIVTEAVHREHRGVVWKALESLEGLDRDVLVLRAIEQNPVKVVAELLHTSEDAVKQRYGRVLRRLRGLVPGSVLDELDEM